MNKAGNYCRILCCALLLTSAVHAHGGESVQKFVELYQQNDTACADRGGKRQYIRSTHKSRAVETFVVRYFMNVRQADRSILILKPGKKSQKLGCTRVFDAEQRWEVIDAVFLGNPP
ncbi:MAG: hypothetical protein ACREVE_14275 [Gammaproteobacteria bacterium]